MSDQAPLPANASPAVFDTPRPSIRKHPPDLPKPPINVTGKCGPAPNHEMRTRRLEQLPPIALGPLLSIMHRHDRNVASPICLLGLGVECAAGGRQHVVDEDDGFGAGLEDGDEGAEEGGGVGVGKVPEHVAEDEGESLVVGSG